MSMNKFMHPKNIYKSPPNFKQIALEYPEFREFVTQDITGKVNLDFKNTKALRALSCILLKKDFGLDVEIPLDKLIPTIPLRLNYILWLEDLLTLTGSSDECVKGVDIGTGASCVYPLIAAKKNKWQMLASEVDINSIDYANRNVEKNNLQELINIVKVDENVVLKDLVKNDEYDFCMCNPPFFGSTKELHSSANSRNLNRPKPKNSFCASTVEVVVKGGEVDFISKLIQDSKILETKVKIYTTMVGCKKSLPELKKLLREVKVASFKETEFCQGNTTRWGLAWTFIPNLDLKKCLDPIKLVTKVNKSKEPLTYIFPINEVDELSLNSTRDCIIKIFEGLQMVMQEVSRQKNILRYFVTAYANTWSHQRRKRREKLRNSFDSSGSIGENNNEKDISRSEETVDMEVKSPGKRTHEDHIEGVFVKKLRITDEGIVFFKFIASLKLLDDRIVLEIDCLGSYNNRDYLHQILQYVKNHLDME